MIVITWEGLKTLCKCLKQLPKSANLRHTNTAAVFPWFISYIRTSLPTNTQHILTHYKHTSTHTHVHTCTHNTHTKHIQHKHTKHMHTHLSQLDNLATAQHSFLLSSSTVFMLSFHNVSPSCLEFQWKLPYEWGLQEYHQSWMERGMEGEREGERDVAGMDGGMEGGRE